jgi:hypothetical protein
MILSMIDRGLMLTMQAIRRQLAAMPHDLYLVRVIHNQTRRAFPGERLWTAAQLLNPGTVRFLRVRNREGCDIYIQPYADDQNAGYILLDLDRADGKVLHQMRSNGHDPCVVVRSSPGHLQAWVHVTGSRLEPCIATAVAKQLARQYNADPASADWRHLGRLAGFTNQKPSRRTSLDYGPWVKVVHAVAGVAPKADALLQSARNLGHPVPGSTFSARSLSSGSDRKAEAAAAAEIYQDCLQRWHIAERFPQPDWSIVDLWVARYLLQQGRPAAVVEAVLRLASPRFPRRHGNADDYLRRTIARAAFPFPPQGSPV